jgi:hypothetical protein
MFCQGILFIHLEIGMILVVLSADTTGMGRAAPGSCGVQSLAVVIAVATSVMVRVSRLPGTVRRRTGLAGVAEAGGDPQDGLPGGGAGQQAALQGVQGGVPADGGEGLAGADAGAGGDGAAEGVAVQEVPVADDQPGGGDIGGDAVGGVQELAGQLGDGGSGVHGDASGEMGRRAGAPGGWPAWRAGCYPVMREGPGAAGRSIGGQHVGAAAE